MIDGSRSPQRIVIAGAGYAGLHIALRLADGLDKAAPALMLVDQYDYHQVLTELPRVAAGTRHADAVRLPVVRLPVVRLLERRTHFIKTTVTGVDLAGQELQTEEGPLPYMWLVLALGNRPNDFGIPGLVERTLSPYSADDAERVRSAVTAADDAAAGTTDPEQRRRLLTVVIGGGGATGVELAGELAEELPDLARQRGLLPGLPRVG